MKTVFKRTLAVLFTVLILLQSVPAVFADSTPVQNGNPPMVGSLNDDLNKKSEELVKNLAAKGIKKAIGKIPVVGKVLESLFGSYVDKLLGIKKGESTNDKLKQISDKLDTLLTTVNENSQSEMKKIYEMGFTDFHSKLSDVESKTKEYIGVIDKYMAKGAAYDDEKIGDMNTTLLIAGLTKTADFDTFYNNVNSVSKYVTGEMLQLHQEGGIYARAFNVYCYDAWETEKFALGGEAAFLASDYVNAINEIVDAAQTTAAMMLYARCSVDADVQNYAEKQASGEVESSVSLTGFNAADLDAYETKYDIIKGHHYDIFGVTEEESADEGGKIAVKPGVVGEYNAMIEDRWFDIIYNVDFKGNVPEVSYYTIDSEIGCKTLADYGFDKNYAVTLIEDNIDDYCNLISKRVLSDKRSALSDEWLDKLLKHIKTSPYFKAEKAHDYDDDPSISLKNALINYGFSFESDADGIFVTNAKCIEDYQNFGDSYQHDGYIDGYVYGIDCNKYTEDIKGTSSEEKHQYFKGAYHSYKADKISADFPEITLMYFKDTVVISSTGEFKEFIGNIAGGQNYAGKTVVLACDLDLGGTNYTKLWTDANRNKEFCGTFDGAGHTVRGLNITAGENRLALFRTTGDGAQIGNLNLENVTIKNTANNASYGALVGYANGNLTVENVTVSGTVTGYKYVGGLIGETKEGKRITVTLKNCSNSAAVTSENVDAGGLVGNCAALELEGCENTGAITAKNGGAGGIVGYSGNCSNDPLVTAKNCKNSGVIVGYDCAGGIIGHLDSDSKGVEICDNENSGSVTVTAKRSAGGIVGRSCAVAVFTGNVNSGTIENKSTNSDAEAGGILGENEDDGITVSGNTNTGSVTANKRAGGIAGTLGDRDHDKTCIIENNTNSGKITSNEKDAGGIIGAVATDNTSHRIAGNTNTGVITAQSEAGGIVGWMAGGGTFESNTNSASVTSVALNAGGITGRIQDDKCTFIRSDVGNPTVSVGEAGGGYVINAKKSGQHAGKLCGWDGKKKAVINSDDLLASIFGSGNVVMISVMAAAVVLAAVIVSLVVINKKKKRKQNS